MNGAIADGGSNRNLTKAGAGTLSAGGNLSIGGNLDVTAGTATFGGSTNTIGGSVSMSGTALTMNGNSTIGNGVSVTAGTATMNGNNTITGSVLVNGGTLTLGGANSISSGVTLSAGTLNVANAGALGTSAMTVNGGTLDNTSGSALALSPSVAEIWNGSFTFAGSNNLDVGSGAVTLNNSITVTTTANTLTVGGVIDDGINVFNLTKAGAGTLVLGGANTYAGSTIIDRGTLRFTTTQSMTVGTNGLTFGAAAGGTTVGTLDLATGVNATFGGTFLVQTNSASANTINIPVGQTLRFNNNFIVGYNSASASTTKLTATGGGTLTIGAAGQPTNLGVNIGNGASAASNAATVDLTGLGTFYANLGTGTFRIGSPTNSAGTATAGSTLILAPTSTIIATTITSDSPDSGVTQALKLGSGTNTLNATTIELGGSTSGRTNGTLDFNGITGTLVVRNLAGTGRVTNINVQNGATGTGSNVSATVNLLGHNADILATTMTVGGRSAGTTGNGTGSFSFDTGTLDLTTLSVASRTGTTLTTGTVTGTVVLGGGTSTIGTLTMATNSSSASTTGDAVATVTISGGTNTISTLTMGVNTVAGATGNGSDTNSTLNISGGNTTVNTAFTMGAENSANNAATTVNNAISALNISGGTLTLAGSTNLTMGSTTLDVNNAATATISITGGTLKVGGNITYAQFAGSTVSNTVTLSGGTLDMDGGTIGATATPVTLNLQSGTLKNLADFNTGAAIVKSTPGVLILDGTNTYTGNTTFAAGGGTIQLGNNNVLPDGSGKGNVDTTNGTLDVNGFSDTINGLLGTGVVTNQLAATTGTLTVGGNNVSTTFSGSMQDGAGVFALGKTGTGTLILDTTNTYSGGTTIGAGIIQVGTGGTTGRLGNGAISDAGTLIFNRSDTYAMDVTNLVTGAGAVTLAGGVTVVAVVNNQFSTTGALNFGISNGAATANNLDLTAGSSSFGTALVRTNNATPNTVTVASGNTFGLTGLTLGYDAGSGTGGDSIEPHGERDRSHEHQQHGRHREHQRESGRHQCRLLQHRGSRCERPRLVHVERGHLQRRRRHHHDGLGIGPAFQHCQQHHRHDASDRQQWRQQRKWSHLFDHARHRDQHHQR